jgi:hypothetical protein
VIISFGRKDKSDMSYVQCTHCQMYRSSVFILGTSRATVPCACLCRVSTLDGDGACNVHCHRVLQVVHHHSLEPGTRALPCDDSFFPTSQLKLPSPPPATNRFSLKSPSLSSLLFDIRAILMRRQSGNAIDSSTNRLDLYPSVHVPVA